MRDRLLYISSHLDCYYFNTEQARTLKRDLQYWSTLSPKAQERRANSLFSRFQKLFANNPLLEQMGFVSNETTASNYPGDITGAAVEAYFTTQWLPLTVHKIKLKQMGYYPIYLSNDNIRIFLEQKKNDLERAVQTFQERCDFTLNKKKVDFSHVLNQRYSEDNKIYRNPNAFSALICIFLHVISALYIIVSFGELAGFFSENMLCNAVMIGFFVLLPGSLNTIIKGFYRSKVLRRFKRAEQSVRRTAKRMQKELNYENWIGLYSKAIRQDRKTVSERDIHVSQLQSSAMLRDPNEPLAEPFAFQKPWKRYRTPGERQHLMIRLIAIAIILYLFSY